MDAWCSPERIRQADLPDEVSNFMRHLRPSRATQSTLPTPIQPESPAVPGDHRLRMTMARAERQPDQRYISHVQNNRSAEVR